jgi:hypothetical protein
MTPVPPADQSRFACLGWNGLGLPLLPSRLSAPDHGRLSGYDLACGSAKAR